MARIVSLAIILLALGIPEPARADDKATCFASGTSQSMIAACTNLIRSGKLRGRDLAIAHNQRGLAYENIGEHEPAIAEFDEAIRRDPKYAIAFNNRSWALNNIGEYDRAIADSSEAIRLNPKYATAYVNRGVSYENKGEQDSAIKDYGEAIRLDPKFAAAS